MDTAGGANSRAAAAPATPLASAVSAVVEGVNRFSSSSSSSSSSGPASSQDALRVLEFWRDFDLDGKRPMLDKQCIEMREAKTVSIAGRKRLNEQTKAFRQLQLAAGADPTAAFNDLLKEYQKEIDQLSGRAKLGETAFLALYKAMYEAPDPTPAINGLSGVLMESSSHQLEIERLKSELNQYDEEFRELKNQDITIRRLEDQIAGYQAGIEERVAEEVGRRTAEIEEAAENRVLEARSAQYAAEKRMASALEEVQASRRTADRCQAQVLEVASEAEGRLGAAAAEIRMLTEDADRLRSRIGDLERELDRMHAASSSGGLGGALSSAAHDGTADGASSSAEYRALQSAAEELRHELQRREDDARADRARYDASLREVNLQLSVEREASKRVHAELLSRPSAEYVASLRRQVRVLQQIAFHGQEEEDADQDGFADSEPRPLESMLADRVKALEAELAEARTSLLEVRHSEAALQSESARLRTALESSSALVARLEADLEVKLSSSGAAASTSGGSKRAADVGLAELLASDLDTPSPSTASGSKGRLAQPSSQSSSAPMSGAADASSVATNATDGGGGGDEGMVHVLQGQRDRYKERLAQAELDLKAARQKLQQATNEKTQLESDNVALYQKIRYLQSGAGGRADFFGSDRAVEMALMEAGAAAGGVGGDVESQDSSRYRGGGGSGAAGGMASLGVESKYRKLYEDKISPFSQFSKLEQQRKLRELSVGDRIVLNTTIACVSNSTGRSILLGYLLAMHVLVFFIVYHMAHSGGLAAQGCDPTV